MTDATTGATDAASAASLMAKPEPQKNTNSSWPGPPGMIPVTSGQADDANVHARAYLDSLLVEMRIMDAAEPDLTTEIFGQKYNDPRCGLPPK